MEENRIKTKQRVYFLDLLKGMAVLLMILAHSIYFFHNDSNSLLDILQKAGNTVAFTTFLLVSAIVSWFAYLKHFDLWKQIRKRILKRFIVFLIAYYTLAIVTIGNQILSSYGFKKWGLIFDVLIFRIVPSYTEYFVPFIIFSLLLIFFRSFFLEISQNIPKAILVATLSYFVGMFLYNLPVPSVLVSWKALLVGHSDWYRFPIFQYAPIYILGLQVGYHFTQIKQRSHQKEIVESLAVISLLGIIISLGIANIIGKSQDQLFLRWPPSIPFLLSGATFVFIFSLIFFLTKDLKRIPLLKDSLLLLGQNAFALWWTHLLLL